MNTERAKIASNVLPHIEFIKDMDTAQEAYDFANALNNQHMLSQ
jgi:hypothetical protein